MSERAVNVCDVNSLSGIFRSICIMKINRLAYCVTGLPNPEFIFLIWSKLNFAVKISMVAIEIIIGKVISATGFPQGSLQRLWPSRRVGKQSHHILSTSLTTAAQTSLSPCEVKGTVFKPLGRTGGD